MTAEPDGPPPELVLASASPRRRELLGRVGIHPRVRPADVEEIPQPGEGPAVYAARMAGEKALAIARLFPEALVLGADTVVASGGESLGKPGGADDARAMLAELAGSAHEVVTAVALATPRGDLERVSARTVVRMRALSQGEIAAYVEAGEWRDKAGGYAIQGVAAGFVTALEGSYTGVVGLPLAEVIELVGRAGGPGPRYAIGGAP